MNYTGVTLSQVGPTYDIAIGYSTDGLSTNMVGYVVAPGSTFEEATDIADEEHIVQVGSPNTTDRFSRYPKVSQGDWSGGERQFIYVDPTRYSSSVGLETSQPGFLRLAGRYTFLPWPGGLLGNMYETSGNINADAATYWIGTTAATNNLLAIDEYTLAAASNTIGGGALIQEIIRGGDFMYFSIYNGSLYQYGGVQVTSDAFNSGFSGRTGGYFNGYLWYLKGGGTPFAPLSAVTYPFPGAGGGTTKDTIWQMEVGYQILGTGPSGIIVISGYANSGEYYVYLYGASRSFLGRIEGLPIDIREAGGDVYILCNASKSGTSGFPLIYKLTGGASGVAVFDDYRLLPYYYQPVLNSGPGPYGRLDTDGRNLYLAWPGMRVKRYSLATKAVVDIGSAGGLWTGTANTHLVAVSTSSSRFLETAGGIPTSNWMSAFDPNGVPVAGQSGTLFTSFYDFGTPKLVKSFKSIEIDTFAGLPSGAAVTVSYSLSNFDPWHTLTTLVNPDGSLICLFPPHTNGTRVALRIVLTANGSGQAPIIQQYSVKATLARVWKATVACRRNQQTRDDGGYDAQAPITGMPNAQSLIANIVNAYQLAAGKVTLYVPDPTVIGGASLVNAELQDYTKTNPGGMSPALRDDKDGGQDMEADMALTLTEAL